ncbi:hypothetical protein DFJ73DRAFT_838813 [Zopfochytrium polystomum]|nr:hypothetical protein DFJ73DRAFT_838813 [Zopfochytrium polystomum]
MDPSAQLISSAAGSFISAGSTIVLATAFWDSIAKINNKYLFWSMIIAIIVHIETGFLDGFLFLKLAKDFDFDYLVKTRSLVGNLNGFAMPLLSFHAAYRALLIVCPQSVLLYLVSVFVFIGSVVIHLDHGQKENHGTDTITSFAIVASFGMAYDAFVMTFFFGLSQITIIRSMSEVYKVKISFLIGAKLLIRFVLYTILSLAYVLFCSTYGFHTAFNLFTVMLLSDSHIVRDIVDHLSQRSKTNISMLSQTATTSVQKQSATKNAVLP